jgi:hypothetical protein
LRLKSEVRGQVFGRGWAILVETGENPQFRYTQTVGGATGPQTPKEPVCVPKQQAGSFERRQRGISISCHI